MRLSLTILLTFALLQSGNALGFVDFTKGLVLGLHLERISPKLEQCVVGINTSIETFKEVIRMYNENKPFYDLGNILTLAFSYIPDPVRACLNTPGEFLKNFDEHYLKKYNYNLLVYAHALFINLGTSMEKIIYNLLKLKENFLASKFYDAGYNLGNLTNIVLNASVVKDGTYKSIPTIEVKPNIDPDDFHKAFVKYFNYVMIGLNYTKFINVTTERNLNQSILGIEFTIITGIKYFNAKSILEGILSMVDILKYFNKLFNGVYFAIQQLKSKVSNTIFGHLDCALTSLLDHLGYFGWHLYMIFFEDKGNSEKLIKRIVIILRKILYFDDDFFQDLVKPPLSD